MRLQSQRLFAYFGLVKAHNSSNNELCWQTSLSSCFTIPSSMDNSTTLQLVFSDNVPGVSMFALELLSVFRKESFCQAQKQKTKYRWLRSQMLITRTALVASSTTRMHRPAIVFDDYPQRPQASYCSLWTPGRGKWCCHRWKATKYITEKNRFKYNATERPCIKNITIRLAVF